MTLSSTHSYVESFPIIRDGTFFSFNITPLSGCQGAEGKFSTLLVALLATKRGGGELYLLSPPSVSTIGWPRSISGVLAWFFTNRLVLVLVRQYVLLLHIGRYKQTVVAVIMWVYYPYHFDLRY